MPVSSCGLRRLELSVAEPESSVDFFAGVLGWTVIAEPGGSFSGWVGDRLAAQVVAGDRGWHVVFGGDERRELVGNSSVDSGRVLHGPWAPPPRHGEPCWVELMTGSPEDGSWLAALGWESRSAAEDFVLFTSARHGGPRAVAGRLTTSRAVGWQTYFAVDDVAAACARVSELDGRVLMEPTTVPTGLIASIEAPRGGSCVLLEKPAGWGGAWCG
ncbi:VOC family protein [Lentzea sp. NEAU-D7]|uniref:VOC family protein n=1 Tax=Lentzea sp. NEAU-D7 TaxID=2994667 RepID=UPI00224AF722|nr:VOC family protein [Lentzea sp. NEAU-D7]MCX2950395.1 VOC family protein [Lentzea sp. NEAU-D7]